MFKTLFAREEISQRRYRLLETLLKVGILSFMIFASFDFFILSKNVLALLNAAAFVIFFFAFYEYRLHHHFMRTAAIATLTLILFFILSILDTQNKDETLLWTIFVPLFALSINGRLLGTLYSLGYFFCLYAIAFFGIDLWNGGHFSQLSYIHYVSVTLLVTLFVYFYERSFERHFQEFLDQNRRLNEAQRLAKIGSWEWDIVNDTSLWSDETFYILGLDPKTDRADFSLSKMLTHPDDRKMLEEAVQNALKNRSDYNIVRRLQLKDGQEKFVRTRGKVHVDSRGEPLKMAGTMQDVTEEKKIKKILQEQNSVLETMFNKANDAILLIKEGRFIDCNDAAVTILGATDKEQVLQVLPGDISPETQPSGQGSRDKAQKMIQKTLQEGSARFECRHLRFDKSLFIVDATLTRLIINNETIIHVSWRDITEKKALEDALQSYQSDLEKKVEEKTLELIAQKEQAEAASRAKSEFLANMNHELRTPMNAIMGFLHLLARDEEDPKRKKYFNLVETGSESLLAIINDVLDFSKIESGKFVLDLRDVEIVQSAKKYIEFLGGAAKNKGIQYNIFIDESIPAMHTDPLRLQQIISNLISNAIKFTPEHGTINVTLMHDIHHDQLIFCVRDSGIGISKANQSKIFDPFMQADMSTTRNYGGTGLGLAICFHLVQILGGKLTLDSQEGKGSEFKVSIPLQRALGKTMNSLDAKVPLREEQADLKNNRPILVAEDNEINLYLYQELFEQLGITNVTFVTNGQEAIDTYRQHPFHLVLLDIQMPIKNGKDTFSLIRAYEEEQGLPPATIVALTASSDEKNRDELLTLGFNGFLAKPINYNSFQDLLERFL